MYDHFCQLEDARAFPPILVTPSQSDIQRCRKWALNGITFAHSTLAENKLDSSLNNEEMSANGGSKEQARYQLGRTTSAMVNRQFGHRQFRPNCPDDFVFTELDAGEDTIVGTCLKDRSSKVRCDCDGRDHSNF